MIIIFILTSIVALALSSTNTQPSNLSLGRLVIPTLLISAYLSYNTLNIQSIGSGIGIYSGLFQVTVISQLFDVFIYIIGALIFISWPISSKEEGEFLPNNTYSSEYSIIILFSILGATLLLSSADLISMYLSIELQSFGVYILTTLYKNNESATSSGLKYFLLGGLSSCFILLGAGLVYAFTGLTQLESIYSLSSVELSNNILYGLNLGILLIFIGFLFKIAAAPFHNWAPDVYDGTPTIVTIWLTIMPKISILIFLLYLQTHIGSWGISSYDVVNINSYSFTEIFNNSIGITNFSFTELFESLVIGDRYYVITNLLLISSLLSLILGSVVGLAQILIKRLLAYSTISHVGFMLLALAINTEQSIDSLIFYIVQYSITNLNIFLIIIALSYVFRLSVNNSVEKNTINIKDIKKISELGGAFVSNPLLTVCFTICLFSMAGTPPLIGFFSKQFVLYSALEKGYYFMSIVGIIVSVISAFYYLKVIKVLHSDHENNLSEINSENNDYSVTSINVIEKEIEKEKEKEVLTINKNNNLGLNTGENKSVLSNFHSFLISNLTLTILLFVTYPSLLINSSQILSLTLFNI